MAGVAGRAATALNIGGANHQQSMCRKHADMSTCKIICQKKSKGIHSFITMQTRRSYFRTSSIVSPAKARFSIASAKIPLKQT